MSDVDIIGQFIDALTRERQPMLINEDLGKPVSHVNLKRLYGLIDLWREASLRAETNAITAFEGETPAYSKGLTVCAKQLEELLGQIEADARDAVPKLEETGSCDAKAKVDDGRGELACDFEDGHKGLHWDPWDSTWWQVDAARVIARHREP